MIEQEIEPTERRLAQTRPDWSSFSHVVRYTVFGAARAWTIGAFVSLTRAEQYARLMGGEENGYVVEEVMP